MIGGLLNNSIEFTNGLTTIAKQTATTGKLTFYGDSNSTLTLSNVKNPELEQDVATKDYVDKRENPVICYASSTTNLTATYSNGTGGIGATLTNSGTQAAFTIDGLTIPVSSIILIKNQSTTFQNGIYILTDTGSASTNWILTRTTNYDEVNSIKTNGPLILIMFGNTNSYTTWVQTATVVTIGTSPILFASFTPITQLTGDISATGTGSVASTLATVNSNVGTFGTNTSVGSFTVNAKGLITAASNVPITYTYTPVNTSTYTLLVTDYVIGVLYTTTGSVTLTLPLISGIGKKRYTIKDGGRNSEINNIVINTSGSDTLEGFSSGTIAINGSSWNLYNDGTNGWFLE